MAALLKSTTEEPRIILLTKNLNYLTVEVKMRKINNEINFLHASVEVAEAFSGVHLKLDM